MTVDIGRILFDKLTIADTAGTLLVKDGRVVMQNLAMHLLEGNMTLNGEYNTQNMAVPFVDFDVDIRQFDISSALSSFSTLEAILPEPQNYAGKVSAALTLSSVLDEHLSPVLDLVNSKGRLQTQNLEIRNSKIFGSMADLLRNERWRTPSPGNINIDYIIKDGRLRLENPIVMNMPQSRLEITGDMGLDATLNYRMDTIVPVSIIGSGAASIMRSIPGLSSLNEIKVAGLIRGTASDPDISLSAAEMTSSVTAAAREQITETVTQRVEEVRTQVNEEINHQIDQIMAEAQRQADIIRSNAKQAADRVRNEANAKADGLISEAARVTNPIARTAAQIAAQEAANTTRREGETAARKLEEEAETQAQTVLAAAQRRADELRRN
jgi:hypothetical protein